MAPNGDELAGVRAWLRVLSVLSYVLGFVFAWRCWVAASDDAARAVGWLTAASAAFWIGRLSARAARRR